MNAPQPLLRTTNAVLIRAWLVPILVAALISQASAADFTATWNSTTGNWSDATKWSTNPLFPNNGNGGFTFNAVQNGGTLTVDQNIGIDGFSKSGGVLQGTNTLALSGLFTFTGGNAAELNGSVIVNANGGTLITGASASSELSIFGSSVLNLNSNTSWTNGRINFANSSQMVNAAGNTFTTNFDGQLFGVTSGGSFINNGTFTKSGGTGSTLLGNGNFVAVTNNGTINVNTGTVRLRNATNTGTLFADTGAGIHLESTNSLNIGSQITGSGTTTQTGTLTVNTTVPVSTTYNHTGGIMNGNGSMNISGPLNFSGGELNGNVTVNASGGTTFNGSTSVSIFGTSDLNLNSNSSWTSGIIQFTTGAVLTNAVGQTFTTTFDGSMNGVTGGGAFVNNGIFNKDGGTGSTLLGNGNSVAVTNNGTINVNSGTIRLRNASNNGTINVGSGNGLLLESTNSLNAGSQITGSGTTTQTGTLTVNTTVPVSTTYNHTGGIMNGNGSMNISGPLSFSGGELNGNVTVNASGGTTFNGSTSVSIFGTSDLNLNSNSSWTSGIIQFTTGAVLTNAVGQTFTTTFDGSMNGVTGGGAFVNNGIFNKDGGTGSTLLGNGNSVAVTNNGTINVNSGTIRLRDASNNGTINVGSGNGLLLESTINLNAGSQITGSGTTTQNGTVTVNATVPVSTPYNFTGGIMNGNGTMNIGGPLNFSGGELNGNVTVNANGGTTISGTSKNIFGTSDLNLNGTSTWTAGQINFTTGSTLNNVGSLSTNFDGQMAGVNSGGAFTNSGTFTKNGGAGTTTIGSGNGVAFSNTGTVNANSGTLTFNSGVTQHSGTTLTGGTWNVRNGSTLNFSAGSNITTIGSAATVLLDGAGSSFSKVTTALATNQGSFTIKNNRDLTTAGNYANSGTTTVEDAGTVMTIGGASTYTQTTGGTLLNGGGLIVASAMNLSGGFIRLTNTSVPASQPLSLSGSASFEGVGSSSWAGTITVSNSVFDISSGTTTLTGQITGTGGITKLGAGTLELADTPPAANNFTGQVVVNAGSLVLNRAAPNTSIPETAGTNGALPLGSRAIEINGGTLVLAQAAQIGDTRTMLLNGGTFDTGGFNETLGALTLQSNSVIDFGSSASLLSFANSSSQAWNVGSTLAIWNWSGTPVTGGGADQLLFGPGGLTVTQASQIAFYSGAGGGFIGMGTLVGSEVVPNGIVPVPEPSAALSAMGLIMLIGWRERGIFLRQRRSLSRQVIAKA